MSCRVNWGSKSEWTMPVCHPVATFWRLLLRRPICRRRRLLCSSLAASLGLCALCLAGCGTAFFDQKAPPALAAATRAKGRRQGPGAVAAQCFFNGSSQNIGSIAYPARLSDGLGVSAAGYGKKQIL